MSCDADAFVIRQGDTLPPLVLDVADCDGPFVFTDWTLTLRMSGPAEVSGAALGSAEGIVLYEWAAGDTAVPGVYAAVIDGVSPTGGTRTFPARGAVTVIVEPR